jgi:hypothetical protein
MAACLPQDQGPQAHQRADPQRRHGAAPADDPPARRLRHALPGTNRARHGVRPASGHRRTLYHLGLVPAFQPVSGLREGLRTLLCLSSSVFYMVFRLGDETRSALPAEGFAQPEVGRTCAPPDDRRTDPVGHGVPFGSTGLPFFPGPIGLKG